MDKLKVKVSNMRSSNGNKVPNQFIIDTSRGIFFQSYDSIIAVKHVNGTILLDETYWNYSNTTSKYRNIFLGETTKETQDKIDNGTYLLADLN
jgi:hypothetical protein